MAYSPPVITAAGLSVPNFADIQTVLLDGFRSIYGSTVYLGNDSADYQWISNIALKLADNMGLCQLAYGSRSPATAIGTDLDSVVKINGVARLASTASSALLVLTGLPGTVVQNAVVSDTNGIMWQLPLLITIGPGGNVSVNSICLQGGSVSAPPNTINRPVGGFTAGWNTVTNPDEAIVGVPVESDSNLRARQAVSVAIPSSTRLAGTTAEIKAVDGVTLCTVYENQTSVVDPVTQLLPHSIAAIVQGGDDLAVATAIFKNRGIGCNTHGATNPPVPATQLKSINVTDPNTNNQMSIGFVRPLPVDIYVSMTIVGKTQAYNTAMYNAIKLSVGKYLDSLQIGEAITQSALYGAALAPMPDLTLPDYSITSLTLGKAPAPVGTTDITLNFWEISNGDPTFVVITPVVS